MLDTLFLQILNMSFTASYVILFVLLARLLLKKAPKIFSYALWSVVLFRLVCPFSFESVFSVFSITGRDTNGIRPFPTEIRRVTPPETVIQYPNSTVVMTPLERPPFELIFTVIWLVGIAALLIYSVVSLLKLRRRLKDAVQESGNIYSSASLTSPFVMGLFRPKIYLPAHLAEEEKRYIILHEQTHIKRLDHVVKIVSFFVLCLHWFNPLVWVAFFLSGRDMELSCDEAVIKKLGSDVKKDYSSSLLTLATGRRIVGGTPLAFGEGDTKNRIKNVLNYKKPAFWVIVVSVIAVVVAVFCLVSNPDGTTIQNPYVQEYIVGADGIIGSVDIEKYTAVSEDFAIGADKYGIAVFKDPHKAFATFETLYADAIELIKSEKDLKRFSHKNYEVYNVYGWQLTGGSKEEQNRARFVSGFLDIYENSFEKRLPNTDYGEPTIEAEAPLNAMRPMIMVDDVLYLDTGKEVAKNVDNSAVLGEIASTASASEKPTENGQCNFNSGVGAKYAAYEDGIAVLLDHKWFFFEKETETAGIGVTTGAKLSSLPKVYSSGLAEKNGDYVDVHGNISNAETMDYFMSAVSKKERAFIRTTIYTREGDPVITDFEFDGKSFSVYRDTTRDKFGKQGIKNDTYQNLVPFISDSAPKAQYFFITNLTEITQKDFEEGVDGVLLLRTDLSQSTTEPAYAEYTMMKLGKNGEVLSSYSLKSKELADAILFDALSKSAAWEGVDVSTLEECYLIRQSFAEADEIHDYYAYRLADETPVLQNGTDGRYSALSGDLYLQLVDSFKSNSYLFFWLKPDEPPQLIGDTAANVWLKSFMNEQTPAESRISDYTITDVTVISGEPKKGAKWEDMAYQYVVQVTYNITTATEQYLATADGISGKGSFQGLFRELCVKVKASDGGGFQIVAVGTGGGEQEFLKE